MPAPADQKGREAAIIQTVGFTHLADTEQRSLEIHRSSPGRFFFCNSA
jgi:hypothetical protein